MVRAPRIALRKISKNDQQKILVPLGRAKGFPFRVLQSMVLFGLSSAGFPTGAQGRDQRFHLYPNEPASHFPQRAGSTATGRLHCCLCNFSRVTQVTQVCKRRQTAPCSRLRLPENTNPATETQAEQPVETSPFLWERALRHRCLAAHVVQPSNNGAGSFQLFGSLEGLWTSVPHPFRFLLRKGWESTQASSVRCHSDRCAVPRPEPFRSVFCGSTVTMEL